MSRCVYWINGQQRCDAEIADGGYCKWHQTCADKAIYTDAHRGPNPPDTPTAGESGEAVTGDSPSPVTADIAADYPNLSYWAKPGHEPLPSVYGEAPRALAEIEAGRNAIAALRMFRRDLLIKDRYTARLEAERDDAKRHEAHWRKEADSWKESVDALTRQVDDLKDAIDTADTAVTAAFSTLKGYAL